MKVVPLLPIHFKMMKKSLHQIELQYIRMSRFEESFINGSESYVLMDKNEPIFAAGITPISEDRAYVWALMGQPTEGKMMRCTRLLRDKLDELNQKYARLEAHVRRDFELGHKWLRVLGFEFEAHTDKFAHGIDFDQYVRIER